MKKLTAYIPILVQNQQVEPIFFVLWHVHPHAITPKLEMHSLVLDIADTV
jgi:hypothetical protein